MSASWRPGDTGSPSNRSPSRLFWHKMPHHAAFALTVADEKPRLLPFGRRVWAQTRQAPRTRETFDFLGFCHVMGTSRRGHFYGVRIPTAKSVRKFYMAIKAWMQANRHAPPVFHQRGLDPRLRGFYPYFGYGTCLPVLSRIHLAVFRAWRPSLQRRSQHGAHSGSDWLRRPWFRLPTPRVTQRPADYYG